MAFDRNDNTTTSGTAAPYSLFPSLTTAQRDAISNPVAGFVLYNTTTNTLNVYNGTSWQEVKDSSSGFIELE
jgi:hypothetical protein